MYQFKKYKLFQKAWEIWGDKIPNSQENQRQEKIFSHIRFIENGQIDLSPLPWNALPTKNVQDELDTVFREIAQHTHSLEKISKKLVPEEELSKLSTELQKFLVAHSTNPTTEEGQDGWLRLGKLGFYVSQDDLELAKIKFLSSAAEILWINWEILKRFFEEKTAISKKALNDLTQVEPK